MKTKIEAAISALCDDTDAYLADKTTPKQGHDDPSPKDPPPEKGDEGAK